MTKIDPQAVDAYEQHLAEQAEERHDIISGKNANSLHEYRTQIEQLTPLTREEMKTFELTLEKLTFETLVDYAREGSAQALRIVTIRGYDIDMSDFFTNNADYQAAIDPFGPLTPSEQAQRWYFEFVLELTTT